MSVTPVVSNPLQSAGSQLLQQLLATGSGAQNPAGLSGLLGDLVTLSPAAQQLTKAPAAVSQAMEDLLSTQQDVAGDLAQLKTYFQENPQGLANVLGSLQGTSSPYGANHSQGAYGALVTALMNRQSGSSDPRALLSLLNGAQGQTSLFSFLDANDSSSGGALSYLG